MSEGVSEVSERTSERTSEWPSTFVPILGCSTQLWTEKWSLCVYDFGPAEKKVI